jgi:hypothetical protein
MGEERLKKQQEHDRRKDKYCLDNNIKLIRIPFWDFDNLDTILNNILINNNIDSEYIINNNKYGLVLEKLEVLYINNYT